MAHFFEKNQKRQSQGNGSLAQIGKVIRACGISEF